MEVDLQMNIAPEYHPDRVTEAADIAVNGCKNIDDKKFVMWLALNSEWLLVCDI